MRFVYARPSEWYFSIDLERKRDVLEFGVVDEIDLNGWDVRKALQLFHKSNPVFVEWLQSPSCTWNRGGFATTARQRIPEVLSRLARRTTIAAWSKPLALRLRGRFGEDEEVLLRPACRFGRPLAGSVSRRPPMEFERLLVLIEDQPALCCRDPRPSGEKNARPRSWDSVLPCRCSSDFWMTKWPGQKSWTRSTRDIRTPAPRLNELFRSTVAEALVGVTDDAVKEAAPSVTPRRPSG